ncbi:cuticle protein 10.9-like [Tachypleus tridentatus]|uniref:cuticle protein 10.9-like n=1 Tax=Tachypleus tridentatus TaxID=6853 RepID=UPI003FD11B50
MLTKIVIFAAIVAMASAGYLYPGAYGGYDGYYYPQPYNYGYDFVDEYGNQQWKNEESDEGNRKVGSYGYRDAYGVTRQVNYVADDYGYRAQIKTNEPGTANQNPADVYIYSDAEHYYPVH